MMYRGCALLFSIALFGCTDQGGGSASVGQAPAEKEWWQWHSEKRDVDMAVSDAINAPDGGDYTKAIAITRLSDRPAAVKDAQIGWLIVNSRDNANARRPAETLLQGLELIESAAMQAGETRDYTPQHLRLLFERGAGIAPDNIPVDPVVADCWRKIEKGGTGDPADCVALRRQRLPRVGT